MYNYHSQYRFDIPVWIVGHVHGGPEDFATGDARLPILMGVLPMLASRVPLAHIQS